MDFGNLINFFSGSNFIMLLFKPVAVFISLFYFLYTVVVAKQTQVMNKTLHTPTSSFIYLISFLQILFSLSLILLSFYSL